MFMSDPIPTFAYLARALHDLHPDMAYLHVTEPRVILGNVDREEEVPANESNDFIRKIWRPKVLISAGGYNRDLAMQVADEKGDLIAFGRPFIANVGDK